MFDFGFSLNAHFIISSKKCSWHFAFLDFWIICMSWAVAIFGFSVMLLCYWMQIRKWYEGCFQIAVFMIWAGSIVGMEISTRQENSDPNNVSGFCRIFLIIWLILFCFFMFVMRSKEFFLTENLVVAIANHGSFFMITAAQCNHGSNLSPWQNLAAFFFFWLKMKLCSYQNVSVESFSLMNIGHVIRIKWRSLSYVVLLKAKM